ncbi:MAG: TatD family hydrolase [Candidatus Omnitrophica bacterium]|jgi:TatD DNase family protein|nr:TatD family hydrolase [Candidatus Omnitrophota bacterium]
MLIDTHCHLDFPEFNPDRDEVIKRAQANGIAYIINIGSSLSSSKNSCALAEKYDFIYAAVGIHPHEADGFDDAMRKEIEILAKCGKVVAIGEIGLDYYKNYSKAENQRQLFESLLDLAKDNDSPVVIHSREAAEDTLSILKNKKINKVVVHCFSGNEDFLKDCLDLGYFISFTCNITYKKAQNLRDLVKLAPLERIFLETDAPYLSPEGLRGRRNELINVKFVAEEISRIKGISFDEVARVTTEAAKNFFNLR